MSESIADGFVPVWGKHEACFRAAFLTFSSLGLSHGQLIAMQSYFGRLASEGQPLLNEALDISCRVEKMPKPLAPPMGLPEWGHGVRVSGATGDAREAVLWNGRCIAVFSPLDLGLSGAGCVPVILRLSSQDELALPEVMSVLLRVLLAYFTVHRGGLLLHSCGIVTKGSAVLFTGRSTVGKSTLARKALDSRALVLSDDINLILPADEGFMAWKVPGAGDFWRQNVDRTDPGSFPLRAIVLLEQAQRLRATRVRRQAEAVAGLVAGALVVNTDPEQFAVLMDVLTEVVERVPIVRVEVALSDSYEAVMEAVEEQLGR